MPRGRPKSIPHLQANDAFTPNEAESESILTEDEMREALKPYEKSGIRLDITDETWFITLRKEARDIKNRVIGSGDCRVAGTRRMPVKDFEYSIRELLIPITPMMV